MYESNSTQIMASGSRQPTKSELKAKPRRATNILAQEVKIDFSFFTFTPLECVIKILFFNMTCFFELFNTI